MNSEYPSVFVCNTKSLSFLLDTSLALYGGHVDTRMRPLTFLNCIVSLSLLYSYIINFLLLWSNTGQNIGGRSYFYSRFPGTSHYSGKVQAVRSGRLGSHYPWSRSRESWTLVLSLLPLLIHSAIPVHDTMPLKVTLSHVALIDSIYRIPQSIILKVLYYLWSRWLLGKYKHSKKCQVPVRIYHTTHFSPHAAVLFCFKEASLPSNPCSIKHRVLENYWCWLNDKCIAPMS